MNQSWVNQTVSSTAGSFSTTRQGQRVLRNTYALLALSLIPTVLGSWVGLTTGIMSAMGTGMSAIVFLAGAFGFMFAIEKFKNSGTVLSSRKFHFIYNLM